MAVTKVPSGTTLRMELRTGTDAQGNPTISRKSMTNIKETAADQDIFDVATSLAGLIEYPLAGVERIDAANLIQS